MGEIRFSLPDMDSSFYSREGYYHNLSKMKRGRKFYNFCTVQEALESNFLQFHVLGRWNGKYIVVLGEGSTCLPELWSIDAKLLEDYAKELIREN